MLLACALLAGIGSASGAEPTPFQQPLTLAILNFANRHPGDDFQWLEKGLADMLITDLSRAGRLQVVDRERMQAFLDELQLGETAVSPATAAALGKMARADRVLTGSFWAAGGRLTIQAQTLDIAAARLVRLEEVEGPADQVLELEKNLALAILDRMGLPLSEAERQALLRLPTRSVNAVAEFYRGIDAWDTGSPADALAAFRSAAGADPGYDEARFREGQMFALMGESEHAAAVFRRLLGVAGGEVSPPAGSNTRGRLFGGSPRLPSRGHRSPREEHPGTVGQADRGTSDFEADALFWLGRLCLDSLARPDEAVACFEALAKRPGPLRLRSVRAFSFGSLGTLPPEQPPKLLLAEALEAKGDWAAAGSLYAEMYRPFIKSSHFTIGSVDDFGESHLIERLPSSRLLRDRLDRFLSRATEATGSVPILPCGMIVLTPQKPAYEEDFRTNKRFNDGFLIESWSGPNHRLFEPGTFSSLPVSVGSGGGVTYDEYHVVAEPGYWIRQLRARLTSTNDAGIEVMATGPVRTLRSKSFFRTTRSESFDFPPGVQQVGLHIVPYNGRICQWRIEAKLEPAQPVGRIRVDTRPRGVAVALDGEFRGTSPLTIGNILPGDHVVQAQTPDVCPRCGRRHHEGVRQFGVYDGPETHVRVEAGRTLEVVVPLRKTQEGRPGWGPAELAASDTDNTDGDVVVFPDGSARAFVANRGGLWTAYAPKPGEWSALTRVPAPVSTIAREEKPRCVLAPDRSVVLVWGVPEPDRYAFFLSRSGDGSTWSYPRRVAASTQIPRGVVLESGPDGKLLLLWTTDKYQSREHGLLLQEIVGLRPAGKPRVIVPTADFEANVDLVPHLVFDRAGHAAIFVGGGVTTSSDLVTWTRLQRVGCGGQNPNAGRAAWLAADGRIVLATRGTSYMPGKPPPPDKVMLHASRDLRKWTEAGSLAVELSCLRARPQPNGLPVLLWQNEGLWVCRAQEGSAAAHETTRTGSDR